MLRPNNAETLRLFLAIALPGELTDAIDDIKEPLRARVREVRWIDRGSVHITLHFLGDTAPTRVPTLIGRLRESLAQSKVFRLHLTRGGAFPDLTHPQVLWIGVGGELHALQQIHATVAEALEYLGFPREKRRFQPHLTIGRVRSEQDPVLQLQIGRAIHAMLVPAIAWDVDAVTLYRSELQPGGSRYTVLDRFPLQP